MKFLLLNKWLHIITLLALLSGALYVREQDYNWVKSMRYLAFDTYNQFYLRQSNNEVVIADIDEISLQDNKMGQWPWPRNDVARLVQNLKNYGAKAIVFDIVFAEVDRTSPSVFLKNVPAGMMNPEIKEILGTLPDHDAVLAKVFEELGNVVTGFVWSPAFNASRRMPVLTKGVVLAKGLEGFDKTLFSAPGVTANISILEQTAAGNGSFGQHPDIDGIIRRVPLLFSVKSEGKNQIYPSLAIEALRILDDPKTPTKVRAFKEAEMSAFSFSYLLKRGKFEIPIDQDANFYIHYSAYDQKQYIPAWKILENKIDPALVNGKIVLIGTSSMGLKDVRSTPLDLYIPGVEVHRNIIEQVIEGRFLMRPQIMKAAEFIFTTVIALSLIVLAPFINALLLCLLTFLVVIGLHYLSFMAYVRDGILIDPVFPAVTIILVFVLSSMLTYIRTEIERRTVKQAFGLYISPDYMKELTQYPERLKLGGEMRPVTVMFSDIRGFTQISENLSPDELIRLMNDFLTPMSDQVMSHRGTIDKYMGDAMMAFWNAPLEDPQHPRNACLAALAMKKALLPINQRLMEQAKEQGKEALLLRAGIGINSGLAAVGNMGSRQRFAYSVMGDTVNLASRLEGQTKIYGVDIIIGEDTFAQIPDFQALEIDVLRVKGKSATVRAYTLLGETKTDEFRKLQAAHEDMLKFYRQKKWDEAHGALNFCETLAPKAMQKYYALMLQRILSYQNHPPSDPWDGIYEQAT